MLYAILNENATENDSEEYVEVNKVILNASFKESVNKGTNVAKEEVHNNETSSKKSDDLTTQYRREGRHFTR